MYFLIFIIVVFLGIITLFLIEHKPEYIFPTLGKKKCLQFIQSPYKFYKYFKPFKEDSYKVTFSEGIEDSLFYLHNLCKSLKAAVSYECFTKYIYDICKYIDLHIEKNKYIEDEKKEHVSSYVRLKVIQNLYIKSSEVLILKGHESDFVKFLYSLRPKHCMSITEKDYQYFKNHLCLKKSSKNSKEQNDEIDFLTKLLFVEKALCGKKSRLLIDN